MADEIIVDKFGFLIEIPHENIFLEERRRKRKPKKKK